MPDDLLMAIPTRKGRSVVRYAWNIDRTRRGEYFPDAGQHGKWGIPLGARNHRHPFLDEVLLERVGGRPVQVMHGRQGGIRHIVTGAATAG